MMRTLLVSALALGATASLALAEPTAAVDPQPGPVELTDAQMDQVTAGEARDAPINPSWGELTSAVASVELGEHASGEDVPRVGLANIVEQGDLAATINLVGGSPLP